MKVVLALVSITLTTLIFSNQLRAQQFHLVKDINTSKNSSPVSNTPTFFYSDELRPYVVLNGAAFFVADDGIHGKELWQSNGTAAGTSMVADIFSGEKDGNPQELVLFNNRVFFTAVNESSAGVWMSDGTSAGTTLLFAVSQRPQYLTVAGNSLYFFAGGQLYKSDGTKEGTIAFLDFAKDYFAYSILWMCGTNDKLLMAVDRYDPSVQGAAIRFWVSDGTKQGTRSLNDDAYEPHLPVAGLNDRFYFAAHARSNTAFKLYAGTTEPGNGVQIKGDVSLIPYSPLVRNNNRLYFLAYADKFTTGLYQYDMQVDTGIALVKHITTDSGCWISKLMQSGSRLFFTASVYAATSGSYSYQLYTSDGSAQGTARLADMPSNINNLSAAGGTVYFDGTDSLHGRELWKSDGTVAGTVLVKDILSGPNPSNAGNGSAFAKVGNKVLFSAFGSAGYELYASDGSAAGTVMVKDINQHASASAGITAITPYKNSLFFTARSSDGLPLNLWKSDGSNIGTVATGRFAPTDYYSGIYPLLVKEDSIYSFGIDSSTGKTGFFRLDANTLQAKLIKDFTGVNTSLWWQKATGNLLYFVLYTNGVPGTWTLWRSDGTTAGTFALVSDVVHNNLYPDGKSSPVAVGNSLYFTTYTGIPSNALWRSDGTVAGTFKVTDNSGQPIINPGYITPFKNKLCFIADNYENVSVITDGKKVAEPLPGAYTRANYLVAAGDHLYFVAISNLEGRELWAADTALKIARLVKDIYPAYGSSDPGNLTAVGRQLFFFAKDGVHGNELWKSDGTPEGTVMVKDISPGSLSPTLAYYGNYVNAKFAQVAGKLYMEVNQQLWVSDGTDTGTHQINDPALAGITSFDNFSVAHNNLWFKGTSYQYGQELYSGEVAPATLPLYTFNGNGDFSDPANWVNSQVPPEDIVQGMEIVIQPGTNGQFILNKPLHLKGGKITIAPGAKLLVNHIMVK